MDFLKSLFDGQSLTYEQLSEKVAEKGFKVADLSKGNYVAKKKYEDDIATRDTSIADLNSQLATRDTDIETLRKQLEDGTTDNATKIADLTGQISKWQADYETAKTDYENKLSKQAYEFAVKDFVNTQQFSSAAARRDFEREMLSAELKMQDNAILGATDFVNKYKEANNDAFIVEKQDPEPEKKPMFVKPEPPKPGEENPFITAFNFNGSK